MDSAQNRLFSVPLDGSPGSEIPLDRSIPMAPSQLSTNALNGDGRLLAPLAPRDSWFNPPGVIDTATGRISRIPSDNLGDYRSLGWNSGRPGDGIEEWFARDAVEVSSGVTLKTGG